MKNPALVFVLFTVGLFGAGCAAVRPAGCPAASLAAVEPTAIGRVRELPAELKSRVLKLDPENVSERDVRELLAQCPAPQVLCIHGGILPIKRGMNSFAQFLMGMGFPEASLRNPEDGSYTYGYYDDSDRIAGTVAWYYERDGLRPVLVGHSQGGIQAMRVLHKLADDSTSRLPLWNPLTQSHEARSEIQDPLTGTNRPVVGVQVCYATVLVAGGLARILPNSWDMNARLRQIPDSVEEFTGFQKGLDPFGGDFLGYGPANEYHATGRAQVRNVRLPATSPHWTIPYTKELLEDPTVSDWVQRYQWRCLVVLASGLIYWGGVLIQARRIRRQIGRSPNVKPHGRKEKALWFGWFLVILVWVGQPLVMGIKGKTAALTWPGLFQPVSLALGIALVVLGYAGTLWSYRAMGQTWRMGINAREKTALVSQGPYRWIRHPIYALQIVMLAGVVLLLPTLLSLITLITHCICVLIKARDEEKHLQAVHGDTYREYLGQTGSLFPRLIRHPRH